jgi:hypothetical protein
MYAIKRDVIDRLAAMSAAGGSALAEHLAKLAEQLADDAVARAKRDEGVELSKLLASRCAGGLMIELIASAFRDAMRLSTKGHPQAAQEASAPSQAETTAATGPRREMVNTDQVGAIESLAKRMPPRQLAAVIEQLSAYEQLLWRNVNHRLIWDNLVVTAASAAPLRL